MPLHVLLSRVAAAAAACASAADCAWSGECTPEHRCACDAAWTGERCTTLALQPAASDAAGLRRANSSSWGGSVAHDAAAGVWRLFFADMMGHCGLDSWQRNSQIGVAVAPSPLGPFRYDGRAVALGAFAHNPTVHGPTADGEYLIFHIGKGEATAHGPPRTDCVNGTTPGATAAAPPGAGSSPDPPPEVNPAILYSSSLAGPWRPFRGAGSGPDCNNPAPALLANGSVLLVCKLQLEPQPSPWRQMAVYIAPTWRGPFRFARLTPVWGEDAYVWRDPARGAFHMLLHAMHPHKVPTTAWSEDGLEWTPSGFAGPPEPAPEAAFDSTIALVGGGVLQTARRERHQPIFDAGGQMVGLCNGVTLEGEGDHSFTACVPVGRSAASP